MEVREGRLGLWDPERSCCQLPQQCHQDAWAPPTVEALEVRARESIWLHREAEEWG